MSRYFAVILVFLYLCSSLFAANEIRSFNAGATTLSEFLMTGNADRNDIQPILTSISFVMMIFFGLLTAFAQMKVCWGQSSISDGIINSATCYVGIVMICMFFLYANFSLCRFFISCLCCSTLWSNRVFIRVLRMAYFAPRMITVFSMAIPVKLRQGFGLFAFCTNLRYDFDSHVRFLFKRIWSEPVSGHNPFLARLIVVCILFLSTLFSANLYAANEVRAFCAGIPMAYYVIRGTDGTIWYPVGQVFETFGTAGRTMADYDLALVNKSGGYFVGNFDTNISAGYYYWAAHHQTGGSPVDADPPVWAEFGNWTGSIWTATNLTAATIADSVWDEAMAGHTAELTFGGELQTLDPNITLILADTSELQTDWTNGGRLDLLIDAIKAITDILPALSTTIASATDPNTFVLTAGLDVNDVYCGMTIYVQDATDSHWESRLVIDWEVGRTVTVDLDFGFTPAAADLAYIWGQAYFPLDIYNGLPLPPKPEVITVDTRASTAGGGTRTLDEVGMDPP